MPVSAEERLLNLIIALMHSRTRMTKDEIRAKVDGYDRAGTGAAAAGASQAEVDKAKATFERMFERDKKTLRQLGVPLVTVTDSAHGDDVGYRIDPSSVTLPPLDFTPTERAVLALAAEHWQGVALGGDATQALVKAASVAEFGSVEQLPFGARSTRLTDATATLAEAIQLRQRVHFSYTSATSGTSRRRVEPWKILIADGNEYVVGKDVDKDAPRTFRLSRIEGKVSLRGDADAYVIPDHTAREMLVRGSSPGVATVALRAEAGHALRQRGTVTGSDDQWDTVEVPYQHLDAVRDAVLALGGAARAVAPPELVEGVQRHVAAALEVSRG